MVQQPELFPLPEEPAKAPIDVDAKIAAIAAAADSRPVISASGDRMDETARRKAATHSRETVPEHLLELWDETEGRWQPSAGELAVGATEPDIPPEVKAEINDDKPFIRLDDTVERRKKFAAPGAHLEQDALAAKIARETREKFHLPD